MFHIALPNIFKPIILHEKLHTMKQHIFLDWFVSTALNMKSNRIKPEAEAGRELNLT